MGINKLNPANTPKQALLGEGPTTQSEEKNADISCRVFSRGFLNFDSKKNLLDSPCISLMLVNSCADKPPSSLRE